MVKKYYGLLLSTCLLWAGSFVISKTLVEHASPMTLTTLRWIIAVICLVPIVWWKEKRIIPPKNAILPFVLMGVTGVVLFNLLQFLALAQTTATNVGLISTLNMISIAICSAIFFKEKINLRQLLAMSVSLLGVLLVLTKGNIGSLLALKFNIGDLWMLAAVCTWGFYTICSKWAMMKTSALMSTLYAAIFGLIMLLPISAPSFSISHINLSFIFGILYTGILATVVSMVFWNICVQHLGSTISGVFLNFNPIFTAILAFLLLGEKLTWMQVIGSVIAIAGCTLFSYYNKNSPKVVVTKQGLPE
ncbi:DMT family transporter [Lysinibacillus sp. NPDC097195]|uniref:DMT family transporter n=1 Tax=Lysinibacillus sp. NPDC097195 TaxID=3364141 RepID=UPI0038213FCE